MRIKAKPRRVTAVPPAPPSAALAHFSSRLTFETDPADVYADLDADGEHPGFLLIDTRSRTAFGAEHLPGAINLSPAEMNERTVARLPRDALMVTYCWSVTCNGSTKGAARLAALGFQVKEMLGGITAWKAEGYPIQRGRPA